VTQILLNQVSNDQFMITLYCRLHFCQNLISNRCGQNKTA